MSEYTVFTDPQGRKIKQSVASNWDSLGPEQLMSMYQQYLEMMMPYYQQMIDMQSKAQSSQLADSMRGVAAVMKENYPKGQVFKPEASIYSRSFYDMMPSDITRVLSQMAGYRPPSGGGGGGGSSSESSPAELPSDWRFGPSTTAAQNNMMTSLGNSGGTLGQAGQGAIAPGTFTPTGTSGATTIAPQSENTSILDFIRKFYPTGSQWVQNYLPEKPLYGPRR